LASTRALYRRIARLRKTLRVWISLQRSLAEPTWRPARPADANLLTAALDELGRAGQSLPPGLGNPGENGYLVMALARQQVALSTFQALLPGQREILARDWHGGRAILEDHLRALRSEVKASRNRKPLRHTLASTTLFLFERPELVLGILALLALHIAVLRSLLGW
jgi:hypothetical protein